MIRVYTERPRVISGTAYPVGAPPTVLISAPASLDNPVLQTRRPYSLLPILPMTNKDMTPGRTDHPCAASSSRLVS